MINLIFYILLTLYTQNGNLSFVRPDHTMQEQNCVTV